MKRFSFKMLAVAAAVCAVCWLGCGGGDDNNPADNSGNNSGNNNSNNNGGPSAGLVCVDGEAWLKLKGNSSCASPSSGTDGVEFKSNGDMFQSDYKSNGVLKRSNKKFTWRTDGNTIIITNASGEESSVPYEMSNGTLTLDNGSLLTKCRGLTIE